MDTCICCGAPAKSACASCESALYCGSACQEQDWIAQHAFICDITLPGVGTVRSKKWDFAIKLGKTKEGGKEESALRETLKRYNRGSLPFHFGHFLHNLGTMTIDDAADASELRERYPTIPADFKSINEASQSILKRTRSAWGALVNFPPARSVPSGKTAQGYHVSLVDPDADRYQEDGPFLQEFRTLDRALVALSGAFVKRVQEPEKYYSAVNALLQSGVLSRMEQQLSHVRPDKPTAKESSRELDPLEKQYALALGQLRFANEKKWTRIRNTPPQYTTDAVESMSIVTYEEARKKFIRQKDAAKCTDVVTAFQNWDIGIVLGIDEKTQHLQWVNAEISLILLEELPRRNFTVNNVAVDIASPEIIELHGALRKRFLVKRPDSSCTVLKTPTKR